MISHSYAMLQFKGVLVLWLLLQAAAGSGLAVRKFCGRAVLYRPQQAADMSDIQSTAAAPALLWHAGHRERVPYLYVPGLLLGADKAWLPPGVQQLPSAAAVMGVASTETVTATPETVSESAGLPVLSAGSNSGSSTTTSTSSVTSTTNSSSISGKWDRRGWYKLPAGVLTDANQALCQRLWSLFPGGSSGSTAARLQQLLEHVQPLLVAGEYDILLLPDRVLLPTLGQVSKNVLPSWTLHRKLPPL
jgi:hypothetical protein